MKEFLLNELFAKCAKKVIPNIDEGGLEYNMLRFDIDEQGPVCSDSELMRVFRNNISEQIDDDELYRLIGEVCYTFAHELACTW